MDKNEAVHKLVRAKGLALALVAAACTEDGTHMLMVEQEVVGQKKRDGGALCSVVTEIYEGLSSVEEFFAQAGRE